MSYTFYTCHTGIVSCHIFCLCRSHMSHVRPGLPEGAHLSLQPPSHCRLSYVRHRTDCVWLCTHTHIWRKKCARPTCGVLWEYLWQFSQIAEGGKPSLDRDVKSQVGIIWMHAVWPWRIHSLLCIVPTSERKLILRQDGWIPIIYCTHLCNVSSRHRRSGMNILRLPQSCHGARRFRPPGHCCHANWNKH